MAEINITDFDKTDDSRVEYRITDSQFNQPFTTLLELAEAPDAFRRHNGAYRLILTEGQNQRLLHFLAKKQLKLENFGDPKDAHFLLAFSFGEGSIVNKDLATIVERIYRQQPSLIIAAQWEIVDLLIDNDPALGQHFHRIELDHDKEYITTVGVVEKFIRDVGPAHAVKDKPQVFIVAQAWHAPRCVNLCNAKGLNVVGGEFSELFSPNDPQSWVRDAFRWALKEGTTTQ